MSALARFVSHHPWTVLLIWGLAALLSLPLAAQAPRALSANPGTLANSESGQVTELLRTKFGETDTNAVVLVTRSRPGLDTPEGRATYAAFTEGLRTVPGVTRVLSAEQATGLVGGARREVDGGTLALTVAQIPLFDDGKRALAQVRAYVRGQESAAFDIRITGGQAIADDFVDFAEADSKRSEMMALPLIGGLLLLVFGALVATGLPLAVGMLSISVGMAGLYGLTRVMEVSSFAQSVVTMLCLGAGIDYALLMVNRFREELPRAGGEARLAAQRTVETAGRSVLFSGATVGIAMAGLMLPPLTFVRSIGIGGVLAVVLTVLASLSALPALLALLGDRVNSPRLLRVTWAQNPGASQAWTHFARRVTARPLATVLLSTAFLLMLAFPALHMRTGYAGAWGLVPGVESRDTLDDVRALGAGGLLSQFEVVLDFGERYTPEQSARFEALVSELRALPGVRGVLSPFLTPADLEGAGGGGSAAIAALSELTRRSFSQDREYLRVTVIPQDALRADLSPAFEARIREVLENSGYRYLLGGAPVGGREFGDAIIGTLPTVMLGVFGATFLLLMVAFRSLLIPLKSIVMNALTVGAAVGVVTFIVQDGHFAPLLGIPGDSGVLDSVLPVLLFAVMFGLSMDFPALAGTRGVPARPHQRRSGGARRGPHRPHHHERGGDHVHRVYGLHVRARDRYQKRGPGPGRGRGARRHACAPGPRAGLPETGRALELVAARLARAPPAPASA